MINYNAHNFGGLSTVQAPKEAKAKQPFYLFYIPEKKKKTTTTLISLSLLNYFSCDHM